MNKILALTVLVLAGFASFHPTLPQEIQLKPKIVRGEDAIKNELPYQVQIQRDNEHSCGGSIINENYILTAGHCVFQEGEYKFTVIAGEHNISSPTNDGTEQSRRVDEILLHENYNHITLENDIALIKLSSPLKLNSKVEPIALPKQGHSATGMALVSGWGSITPNSTNDTIPAILQKLAVPMITKEDCKAAYANFITDTDITEEVMKVMICAGYMEGGNDSCRGDSGGPLVAFDDGKYLAGVVSFGGGECAEAGKPGVYADVSYFVPWINQKMGSGQVVFLDFVLAKKVSASSR